MNDDLHKTSEPESVPDDLGKSGASAGGWKMPEPVFRRSGGRIPGAAASEPPKAPATFVPEKIAEKLAEVAKPTEDPLPEIEPQPFVSDSYDSVDEVVADLNRENPVGSNLHFGIAAVVVLAMIGIVSALLIAVWLGFIVWR